MTASRDETSIFGVRLHQLPSWGSVRIACESFLSDGRTHCVYTPNPEILLYARKHVDYATLLNEADLALPDGFGIVLVHLLRRRAWMPRWAGIDVAELILRLAAERGARVMFLGGRDGIGDRAAARWRSEIPGLDVVTAGDNVRFDDDGAALRSRDESELEERIRDSRPAVIFVSIGHPKQERWIVRHRPAIPSARVMIGVGGALDVWGGRYSRAPGWLRSLGFEWLWRLFQDPARLPRILRATIEFPARALTE
jgi:N-acetylglucosaminyldiphosphoundecaprenol N-acetyl-beta-D-mannosaminyltransferase